MGGFEIIVKDEKEALRLKLPDKVVERIKRISSLSDNDFKELDNEDILKVIIKSLDDLLYGFEYTKPHSEKNLESKFGTVATEKVKNGNQKSEN